MDQISRQADRALSNEGLLMRSKLKLGGQRTAYSREDIQFSSHDYPRLANGFELSRPARAFACSSTILYQNDKLGIAPSAGSAAARACVKSLIFLASTGQRPTFYTLRPVFQELTLENKQILVFSSHRLSFFRLFTQHGELLGCL